MVIVSGMPQGRIFWKIWPLCVTKSLAFYRKLTKTAMTSDNKRPNPLEGTLIAKIRSQIWTQHAWTCLSMRRELSSLEDSSSHRTQAAPLTLQRGREGSSDCMWGVQTHIGSPLFLVPFCKYLARIMAHHNQIRNDCRFWESVWDLHSRDSVWAYQPFGPLLTAYSTCLMTSTTNLLRLFIDIGYFLIIIIIC